MTERGGPAAQSGILFQKLPDGAAFRPDARFDASPGIALSSVYSETAVGRSGRRRITVNREALLDSIVDEDAAFRLLVVSPGDIARRGLATRRALPSTNSPG